MCASEGARHGCAVRPPHPDPDHMLPVIANGPGVAVAVGGARLVGQSRRRTRRRRDAAQDISHLPCGTRREVTGVRCSKSGVDRDQILKAEAHATQRHRQPGLSPGQFRVRAQCAQSRHQPFGSQRLCQCHRRDVQR